MKKTPESEVVTLRSAPVLSFLTFTVAPGITAPVVSATVPERRLWSCADRSATDTDNIVKNLILPAHYQWNRCEPMSALLQISHNWRQDRNFTIKSVLPWTSVRRKSRP